MLMTLPEMWDFLSLYLQYSFVQRAMIVTVLVALCSALLGVTLVLRRFSFIGDGLSHVAFGAMAVAAVLNLASELPLVLAVTVICAVLLLRTGQNAKIMGDAAMAMVSVGALAIGYLLMNIFSSSTNLAGDVCTTLFGSTSILTLTEWEVWLWQSPCSLCCSIIRSLRSPLMRTSPPPPGCAPAWSTCCWQWSPPWSSSWL